MDSGLGLVNNFLNLRHVVDFFEKDKPTNENNQYKQIRNHRIQYQLNVNMINH